MSTATNKEFDILSRLELPLSREGARDILKIEFSAEDRERMRELLEKGNRGERSTTEDDEAADFERIGHVLSMLKSIARRTLKSF